MGAYKKGQERGVGPYTTTDPGIRRDRSTDDAGNPREPARQTRVLDILERPGPGPLPKDAR